ncbi:MAG: hypothetical protein ACHQRJ_07140 [Alphaproteobacteria bacterium]
MEQTRTIEIDFDVHKAIEVARLSFAETPNDVLRRMLGLNRHIAARANSIEIPAGRSWSGKGVALPHGTKLRMDYNGKTHFGEINNGEWHVEGGIYRSPSAAAGGVAKTKTGKRPSLDGWIYWWAKLPGGSGWVPLSSLRRKLA